MWCLVITVSIKNFCKYGLLSKAAQRRGNTITKADGHNHGRAHQVQTSGKTVRSLLKRGVLG